MVVPGVVQRTVLPETLGQPGLWDQQQETRWWQSHRTLQGQLPKGAGLWERSGLCPISCSAPKWGFL